MIKSVHVIPKLNSENNDRVKKVIDTIKEVALELNIRVSNSLHDIVTNEDLIIAVGGDGTMLEAMRSSARCDIPVMGINLGKVGFLTDFSASFLPKLLDDLYDVFENQQFFPQEKRIAIAFKPADNKVYSNPAFNEYVISNSENDGIISYSLKIGNMHAGIHKATSLIINVPTGSTAYGLSAGGSLILPSMHVFQIIPLAPLSMTSRPIIVPSNNEITLEIETSNDLTIRADGQRVYKSKSPLIVSFKEHHSHATILHSKDWNFFDMLTQKLGWKNY